MDPINYLISQHRQVEDLFRAYEAWTDGASARALFDDIDIALSGHAAIEEMHVYPLLRDRLADGERIANRALAEQQIVKERLKALEGLPAGSRDFDQGMRALIGATRAHVEEEEETDGPFSALRRRLSPGELDVLAQRLRSGMARAPTRAHPLAPDRPPANALTTAATALVDRSRDALTGRRRRRAAGS